MATQAQPVSDFPVAFRQMMLDGLQQELEITKKVLGAVPDAQREWRPDPKARTAWELAWHIAMEDVMFLEQITELKFSFPDDRYKGQEPKTI
ncbi:MAG: DinB family protein, partial [Terriglobales bacterium]